MNTTVCSRRTHRGVAAAVAATALLLAVAVPALAQVPDTPPARWLDAPQPQTCALPGSWLAEVDIGGSFFVEYAGGPGAVSGPLTVQWILFDPTLFGNFPSAAALTPGVGGWERHGGDYTYTWVAYGLDGGGLPVHAIKGSGHGVLESCDTIEFDWVLEVFPWPMSPLTDDPVTCLSGVGSKTRIPVKASTCQ